MQPSSCKVLKKLTAKKIEVAAAAKTRARGTRRIKGVPFYDEVIFVDKVLGRKGAFLWLLLKNLQCAR